MDLFQLSRNPGVGGYPMVRERSGTRDRSFCSPPPTPAQIRGMTVQSV
jgi:hypothetical protein